MAYTAQITRANPTLIVFLLDQSGSMADPFGGEGSGRKADFVANAVNHALHDLVIRCTKTEEVRDYYHVATVGYGRQVGIGLGGALAPRRRTERRACPRPRTPPACSSSTATSLRAARARSSTRSRSRCSRT